MVPPVPTVKILTSGLDHKRPLVGQIDRNILLISAQRQITTLAIEHRLPAIYEVSFSRRRRSAS
jgi:hypothetical protein